MSVHRRTLQSSVSSSRPALALIAGALVAAVPARPPAAAAQTPAAKQTPAPGAADWTAVDRAMGRTGTQQPGGVYRYGFPRSDLRVRVGNLTVKPALALGGWVAFKRLTSAGPDSAGTEDAVAMGDLVLLEREVAPVMSKLQEMGVSQTALHDHLLRESPRVLYMHIEARGDPVSIARAIHAALAVTGTPPARAAAAAAPLALDTAGIAAALGRSGKVNGGVYQVSVPRAEAVTMGGVPVPPSMGVATGINFQPTGGGKAVITGDFVLAPGEVNPVIQALRNGAIEVTALHSHMLEEEPRLFFMHFWGSGDGVTLARGLRAALDQTRSAGAAR